MTLRICVRNAPWAYPVNQTADLLMNLEVSSTGPFVRREPEDDMSVIEYRKIKRSIRTKEQRLSAQVSCMIVFKHNRTYAHE